MFVFYVRRSRSLSWLLLCLEADAWLESVPAVSIAQQLELVQSVTHHECTLLLSCLKAAVAKLGSGINEFEFNGFVSSAARMHQKGLKEKSHSAAGLSLQKIWMSALMKAVLRCSQCIHQAIGSMKSTFPEEHPGAQMAGDTFACRAALKQACSLLCISFPHHLFMAKVSTCNSPSHTPKGTSAFGCTLP